MHELTKTYPQLVLYYLESVDYALGQTLALPLMITSQ
jgi:hypothetical protein